MEKCNIALEEAGHKPVTSKTTIIADIAAIEANYPDAEIIRRKVSRNVYYEYADKSFSIYNIPLSDDEMAKLAQTLTILSKFEGMPNFEWIDDLIEHFKSSLNIPTTKQSIVAFDENMDLEGRNHFARLFTSIVSEQALKIQYQPFEKESKEYVLHPYFLKQFNNRWFLFGSVDGFDTLSNFPLDRIVNIENADIRFKPNTRFEFNEIFEEAIGVSHLFDTPQKIQIRVNQELFPYIKTKPLHGSQRVLEKNDKYITIQIEVVINRELKQLILSYGAGLTVISPQELVQEISAEIAMSNKNYESVQLN